MKALLYKDTFPRLLADMRERPGKWLSRLVFLLGPWACLWMVEILNENDIFSDLDGWQVLMNLVWYYGLFFVLRLVLGRNRRAAALGACLAFTFGLVNHYVLRFRGRILFPADITGWRTAANVADGFDYSPDLYITQAAILLVAYLALVFFLRSPDKTGQDTPALRPGPVDSRAGVQLCLFLHWYAPGLGNLYPAVGHSAQRLFT